MKRTRLKLTKDEAVSIVISEDNNLICIDIIDKTDIEALDKHYAEEFEGRDVLPFVMNPDQFNMVIKHGMVPVMEMIVENITGSDIKKAMGLSDDELGQAIVSKLKFNEDKSVN